MDPLTTQELYEFIQERGYAVISTVSGAHTPEAALVAISATPELELVFDTVTSSRKYENLMRNPAIALVIGFAGEMTLQYEGEAVIPGAEELDRYKEIYFDRWPDGRAREAWPGLVHFRVKPKWIRFSDYNRPTGAIRERSDFGDAPAVT